MGAAQTGVKMSAPLSQFPFATPLTTGWLARPQNERGESPVVVRALRALFALPLRIYLRTYHRLTIEGRHHLPRTGSFVMVANHASHLDALCLLAALPLSRLEHAFSAAAQDYFFVNRSRGALAAIFANAVPFGRTIHLRRSL